MLYSPLYQPLGRVDVIMVLVFSLDQQRENNQFDVLVILDVFVLIHGNISTIDSSIGGKCAQ